MEKHRALQRCGELELALEGVLLHRARAQSHNVATARLGLDLGIERVVSTLRELGVTVDLLYVAQPDEVDLPETQ